jgi:hypothetical protein
MKKHHFLILLVLLAWAVNTSMTQQPSLQKYIVVTFEEKWKISGEGPYYYYWIVPEDSVKSDANPFSYLLLRLFHKNELTDCCNGKDFNPFVIYTKEHYEDLDAEYNKNFDQLMQIVLKKRKKVQEIIKKWQTGQEQDITVFATPVSGKFCSSYLDKFGQYDYHYKEELYLPYSSFTYTPEFWDSAKAKFILHEDYSKINFKIFPPLTE